MAEQAKALDRPRFELPAAIAGLAGRMIDADQHECTPINLWVEEFGEVARPMVDAFGKTTVEMKRRMIDDVEINAETVFRNKLENAPGAFDFDRRLEVMDFIGLDRALIFPGTLTMIALSLSTGKRPSASPFFERIDVADLRAYGRRLVDAWNDWCLRMSRKTDRLRPVAILIGDTAAEMLATARKVVDGGVRGVWIPSGVMPAGLSPAHPEHDPLWALLSSGGCPVIEHTGGQSGFLATDNWPKAPAFEGWTLGGEFSMNPWMLSTQHFAPQSFITAMVIGGVFERHPDLRYGTAEFTGHWVGPMTEAMDLWLTHKPFRSSAGERVLSMPPSEYVRRNIRVACFDFEPIDRYIERFGFEEVYCYCSDYPHNAGGQDPIGVSTRNLEPLGAEILKGFFVDNGRLLLPD